jgi:spermidine synthase
MTKQQNRRIGIVGLGVGTLAAYGRPSDTIRFYEINPQVEVMARKYFTYLSQTPAQVELAAGDARLSMDYENPQHYDVLVLDAFSSDAVPVHLLTQEAFEIYLKHIADDGIMAFHISTMHLNLHSVVWKAAERLGLAAVWIENDDMLETGVLASDWILLAQNPKTLDIPLIQACASPPEKMKIDVSLWTDDHINLLQILR